MKCGSLFAGIGGFDLAAQRVGWTTVWHSEVDLYTCAVFAQHFPASRNVGDVTRWEPNVERDAVDIIFGGFPCQPVSLAGKQRAQQDDRWLWPQFARVVRVLRPKYVLVENVPGLLVRGLGDVLGDLATMWYDAEWSVIPATAVGAPHRRDRVWLLAYPVGLRGESGFFDGREFGEAWGKTPMGQFGGMDGPTAWLQAIPALCGTDDGLPAPVDRLRCLGNSIVPEIPEMVFRQIQEHEKRVTL